MDIDYFLSLVTRVFFFFFFLDLGNLVVIELQYRLIAARAQSRNQLVLLLLAREPKEVKRKNRMISYTIKRTANRVELCNKK